VYRLILTLRPQAVLYHVMTRGLFLFLLSLVVSLKADDGTTQFPPPTADQRKAIQEKSLSLLRDLAPASSSDRTMKTMAIDGGQIYWGNLFDQKEVVALVNLAPEKPQTGDEETASMWRECWPCYLSLCSWERDHWVYRKYLDNAHSLVFHDRNDSPRHFVQASRKTGRYEGDFLSWYYDPKTKTLVRTNYETWGPFFLVGNYLCTTRGFERRAMEDTVWVYPYKQGKKGDLLAIYDSDVGTGELKHFSITFRNRQTKKLWTYSFNPQEVEPPYLNYTVDAVEGALDEKMAGTETRVHYSAAMMLTGKEGGENVAIDTYCFERLTGLSIGLVEAPDGGEPEWRDVAPKTTLVKQVKIETSGDPEIVRHLKNR
jgi:hypothetical protein